MLYEIGNWSVGLTDIASLIHYLMEQVAKVENFFQIVFLLSLTIT